MSDFKPIYTQEELDQVIKDRIKRAYEHGRKDERNKVQRVFVNVVDYLGKVARSLDD